MVQCNVQVSVLQLLLQRVKGVLQLVLQRMMLFGVRHPTGCRISRHLDSIGCGIYCLVVVVLMLLQIRYQEEKEGSEEEGQCDLYFGKDRC